MLNFTTKEKKLINDTLIYMIGGFGSKLISVLFLPLITMYMTAEEYGIYDIITTTTAFLIPIFTLQVIDALFRFMFNNEETKCVQILSNVFCVLLGSTAFLSLLLVVAGQFYNIPYCKDILLYYISFVLIDFWGRSARGLGENQIFAISGIFQTAVYVLVLLPLLVWLKLGVEGMILAYALSTMPTMLLIESKIHLLRKISFRKISFQEIKSIIRFSSPLVINCLSWSCISYANKYIVLLYFGATVNGLYAVALKYASVLTLLGNVFLLAWQETLIREFAEPDLANLYKKVCNSITVSICLLISLIFPIIKYLYPWMVSPSYQASLQYIPWVFFSAALATISSMMGTVYLATKETRQCMKSTIIGGIASILVCYITALFLGPYSAMIGTILGHIVIIKIRTAYANRIIGVKLNLKNYVGPVTLILLSTSTFYLASRLVNLIYLFVLIIAIGILFMKDIKEVLAKVASLKKQ